MLMTCILYSSSTHNDEMCNFYFMFYTNSSSDQHGFQCWDNTFPSLIDHLPAGNDVPLPRNPALEDTGEGRLHSDQGKQPSKNSIPQFGGGGGNGNILGGGFYKRRNGGRLLSSLRSPVDYYYADYNEPGRDDYYDIVQNQRSRNRQRPSEILSRFGSRYQQPQQAYYRYQNSAGQQHDDQSWQGQMHPGHEHSMRASSLPELGHVQGEGHSFSQGQRGGWKSHISGPMAQAPMHASYHGAGNQDLSAVAPPSSTNAPVSSHSKLTSAAATASSHHGHKEVPDAGVQSSEYDTWPTNHPLSFCFYSVGTVHCPSPGVLQIAQTQRHRDTPKVSLCMCNVLAQ